MPEPAVPPRQRVRRGSSDTGRSGNTITVPETATYLHKSASCVPLPQLNCHALQRL